MTRRSRGLWVLMGVAAALVSVLLPGVTPEAAAQGDTLTQTYTTMSGITLGYPEGWIVTETVDGGYTLIELDNLPSADEKDLEEALDSGEAKIGIYMAPASRMFADMGWPADTTPDQVLMGLLDPTEYSFQLPYAATIGGAPAARVDGSAIDNRFDFTALFGLLSDGTAVFVQANTARGEMQNFEATITAICESIIPGSTGEPAESASVPENNAVAWQTETVSLTADNFYIIANGQVFTADVAGVDVRSDPGDAAYTTLEVEWEEHGVLMRLNMYFESDGRTWQAFEIRNYDGAPDGEWITYEGTFFTSPLGEPYEVASFEQLFFSEGLYFENLRVQAFTSGEAGAEAMTEPTEEPTAEPTEEPAAPAGQEIRQWASQAAATSQYGDEAWSAAQATGAPDTAACGDYSTAWASSSSTGVDKLMLFFDTPVLPTQINIYQTYNPGAISSITLLLAGTGDGPVVPNSADPGTGCPGVFTVSIPDDLVQQPIAGIAILVDQSSHSGWNEIDAVELVGYAATATTVSAAPSALSQVLEAYPNYTVMYPEGWAGRDNPGIAVFLSNNVASIEVGGDTTLAAGVVRLRIQAPRALEQTLPLYNAGQYTSLVDLVEQVSRFFMYDITPVQEPVATTVGGREAARIGITRASDDAEGFIVVWFIDDTTLGVAIATAHVGESAQFEPLALEIIESVRVVAED